MTSLSYLQRLVIILTLVGCTHVCYAQAPGNISSNLQLWLKTNAGTSTTTDGSTVTTWNDQSGNSANVTAGNTPSYQSNTINYNPSILYESTDRHTVNTPSIEAQNTTIYFVGKPGNGGGYGLCEGWVTNAGGTGNDIPIYLRNGYKFTYFDDNPWNFYETSLTWSQNESSLARAELSNASNYNASYSKLGGTAATLTSVNGSVNTPHNYYTTLGNWPTDDYVEPFGYIAETIIYNTASQSSTEKNKIETYLAVKYGLTLDNAAGGTAGDYTSSAGTLLWDASAVSTYHYDLTGIGRDDNSALGQVKSKSENSDGILTIYADGEGTNASNSFVDIANNEWMLCGNNNGAATFSTTGAPASYRILARQWHVEETGDVGNCSFWFNIQNSSFNVPVGFGDIYYLLHDSDNDNSLSDETLSRPN